MKTNQNKAGFTLIELLVVVLIIGILASVALPQYNKAVRKARLSEVATTFNAISKGIDAWLLENGYPSSSSVYFSGNNPGARLDIAQTCATENGSTCFTKVGRWEYWCSDYGCRIRLETQYNTDKTTGNKWLDGERLEFARSGDSLWGLHGGEGGFYISTANRREICRWWKDMYGDKRVNDGYGAISDSCDAY